MDYGMDEARTISGLETMRAGESPLLAGRYKVVRRLGEGGMGSVWLVEDTKLDGRQVAIKMLPAVLAGKKGAYRQVKQEALMAMKLSHPNIATVRAFEEDEGGSPFLVMDYIEGTGLDDILAEKGALGEAETLKLLGPVAAALDYAHAKGVVHRDVKPGNVMVDRNGTPFVLDFGIAREIQETMTRVTGKSSSGTLLYMSPEQLNGRAPKAAQDVYSFAAMAYECLTGAPPFPRGQIEWQIVNNPPEPLPEAAAGEALRQGVMAGLAKEPETRPGTCLGVLGSAAIGGGGRAGEPEKGRTAGVANGTPARQEGLPRRTTGRMDEGGEVFLRKVKLEKMLENAHREGMTPAELERLGKIKTLFAAGRDAMQSGQNATASALFAQTEERLKTLREAFAARRKEEIQSERAHRELERCREVARKAREAEARKLEEAEREKAAKRQEEENARANEALQRRRRWMWFFVFVAVAEGAWWQIGFSRNSRPPAREGTGSPAITSVTHQPPDGKRTKGVGVAPSRLGRGAYAGQMATITLPGGATMVMVWCPPGTFVMGSPESEEGRKPGETQHEVTLTKGFWMSQTEVTQRQWKSVMGGHDNPSYFPGEEKPVDRVNWNDCQAFCARAGSGFRLPTEAEWEYACRAGTRTALPNGDIRIYKSNNAPALDEISWYAGNSSVEFSGGNGVDTSDWPGKQYPGGLAGTHAVGRKAGNAWGFHDMIGNVNEWCSDWYGDYPDGTVTDPTGGQDGTNRVSRGGCWAYVARACRSAHRDHFDPGSRGNLLGFRVCYSEM